ncbi:MAG: carbamoyl-phosphate synthase large subunit [Deltaproteobacteria bacterium]|nr:carbamoyl-phosphate synthase large subunit [Deltaproteobacteria bacterium]
MVKLLIANRGEIAVRIARAAAELGIRTVAVHAGDDAASLHTRTADEVFALPGRGAAAYLDIEQIVAAARTAACDAIHPGYGFLSESSAFARRCAVEGLMFVGPRPEVLDLFGDKAGARAFAARSGVPVLPGTPGAASLEEARDFFSSLPEGAAVMIKALAGGGGRGIRTVNSLSALDEAYARCVSEALAAFGQGEVYVEQLVRKPRHIEVQIVGDGTNVIHLGERDCTLQRRNQKIVEVAPCPNLSSRLRDELTGAAARLAREAGYDSLGTFEFLVGRGVPGEQGFVFMEANPRLQVEHTVTEEVTGVDLVRTQLEIASGRSLRDLGLTEGVSDNCGYAIEMRINTETMDAGGGAGPEAGTLSVYEVASGPGVRVDGCGYTGYTTNPAFDSLLAKLIVTSRSGRYEDAVAKACRALSEFRIEGVATNLPFLRGLLRRPEVALNDVHTRFIEDNAAELAEPLDEHKAAFSGRLLSGKASPRDDGVRNVPTGTVPVGSPVQGRVVSLEVAAGDAVAAGQTVAVIEAMKMEHIVTAERSGYVRLVCAKPDAVILKGAPLFFLEEAEIDRGSSDLEEEPDLDLIRPDLAEVRERHAFCLDEQRPEAVARRRRKNQRTARENVSDLCDPGSFIEYGALLLAAQRRRRSLDDLIRKAPADGLITGVGSINGSMFGDEKARCMVMAYDYTVMAGTQGLMNHKKMDRMLSLAHDWQLPVALFAEGGGGRPSDTDANVVAALDITTFSRFAGLSGKVPLVGIVSGPCFAGNAALLGCCDVIIATKDSNIGMGGPAMIEGGGLGTTRPEEIGPIDVQTRNGVVDIAVADEAEAVSIAKKYLSYYQGATTGWEAADQRLLRRLIPENRLRVYEMRKVIEKLADAGSVLELRRHFGAGMITVLIRIEGRPMGVIANNPMHMGGAIEAEAADKAARFMQLCNAYGLPILSLCDTPGFMVGPETEARAQVRHVCRMFVGGAAVHVPFFTIVLRKGYGLGAMAMAGGGFHGSFFTSSWPSGEFGAMGLEGAVKHGFRKELEAIENPADREATIQSLVDQAYEMGKAINTASYLEIDAVIDPADTRGWIMRGLRSLPAVFAPKADRSFIDTW